jgi:iron(III) transport system permease protein
VLSSAVTWTATQHSLVTAVGGTLLALAIGGVVALVVSLTDIRARNAFVFCFVLPMMIAPQVVALAWLQLFGPASPLLKALGVAQTIGARNPLYSPQGIIVVLGVQYAPLVFLTLRAGLRTLPRAMIEAGLAGGAGPLTVLRTIVLPLMTPPLVAGVALTFVSGLGNFGIPRARHSGRSALPTLIYQRWRARAGVLRRRIGSFVLIGFIAIVGIAAGRDALPARHATSSAARLLSPAGACLPSWRPWTTLVPRCR